MGMTNNSYEKQLERHITKLERQLEEAEKEIDSVSRENSQLRADANRKNGITFSKFVSFYFDDVVFDDENKKKFLSYFDVKCEDVEELGKSLSSSLLYVPDLDAKTLDNLNRRIQSLKENKSELQIAYEEEIENYEN